MEQKESYILGLDLGANSIGWALLEAHPDPEEKGRLKAHGIKQIGVRIFEAGVEGEIEQGKDQSRAVDRRDARLARRRLDRISRRLSHLFYLLMSAGLLPEHPAYKTELGKKKSAKERKQERDLKAKARHEVINQLDQDLVKKWREKEPLAKETLPYILRAKALDEKLELYELGRALFHLAQRRGFLCNRKAKAKDDEELGKVNQGILELEGKIEGAGARTLGEYFSKLNPKEERIRSRWTSREMYLKEFEQIWNAQEKHYPKILTPEFKKKIWRCIFYQRPLKIQHHLIGECQYEKGKKRAPSACLAFQRFRMLQQLNNSYLISPDGEILNDGRLTKEQRERLIEVLEKKAELKFSKAKKILGLTKEYRFNFEKEDGKGEFLGNETAEKLIKVFGEERWSRFSEQEKNEIVQDLISIQHKSGLVKRGKNKWGLDDENAEEFSKINLEEGYCGLSRLALSKLIPLMETGLTYMEAVKQVYPDRLQNEAFDQLPMVINQMPELKNPVVKRVLTELRKIVNAIIRKYGKPEQIRIELAREMKKTRQQREEIWKKNKQNEEKRKQAAQAIIKEAGENPKPADIEKYLLWDECNGICPYTGKSISLKQLFSGEVDVEHIIPYSICLDNSYFNKTLCFHDENAKVKNNKTPWQAYGSDEKKWNEILERVKRFKGDAAKEKLKKFQIKDLEELDDFISSQLNDTKYASKLAKKFLGLLYPGQEALSRVQATKGGITANLRDVFNLNSILKDGDSVERDGYEPKKTRADHRHHAIDAICIALTEPSTVKMLSEASSRALKERKRRFGKVQPPWENFWEDVKKAIDNTIVSHRVSKKVNGPLHQETFYSPPKEVQGKIICHVRKPLENLSAGDIEDIVDPVVKKKVQEKIKELGGGDPKKLFAGSSTLPPEKLPCMTAKDGRVIPIRKVRIKCVMTPFQVGDKGRERFVTSDTNHHLEIFETKDKKGNVRWDGAIVSQYEAMRRLRAGEPIVKREHGKGKEFKFSLALNECVKLLDEKGQEIVCVVKGISQLSAGPIVITLRHICDARPTSEYQKQIKMRKELKKNYDKKLAEEIEKMLPVFIFKGPDSLREAKGQKILITPLGEIRTAND